MKRFRSASIYLECLYSIKERSIALQSCGQYTGDIRTFCLAYSGFDLFFFVLSYLIMLPPFTLSPTSVVAFKGVCVFTKTLYYRYSSVLYKLFIGRTAEFVSAQTLIA